MGVSVGVVMVLVLVLEACLKFRSLEQALRKTLARNRVMVFIG
jgi:hypothetical protein